MTQPPAPYRPPGSYPPPPGPYGPPAYGPPPTVGAAAAGPAARAPPAAVRPAAPAEEELRWQDHRDSRHRVVRAAGAGRVLRLPGGVGCRRLRRRPHRRRGRAARRSPPRTSRPRSAGSTTSSSSAAASAAPRRYSTACWPTPPPTAGPSRADEAGRLARVARYSGGDAAARFAKEKTAAQGTTEDRGNGLSVSTDAYFAGDAVAGDQAFCTSGDALGSAGALVRRGDTLIYVSTTAAGDGASAIPQIGVDDSGRISFATDKANCDKAVALAAKVK